MITVIIAGGSGTRLWPLSTPSYPKHLLNLGGDELSLLQQTYDRASTVSDTVYVVSEAGHVEHVKSQLSDLENEYFLVEPARRGTASCIIAALAYITHRHASDEPIAFMHSDHYIRDKSGFVNSFKLANSIADNQQRIVLVGVEPDHASTAFGYIEKGDIFDEDNSVYNVKSFKEKPDFETAEQYVNSGKYLWNGGYFVATLSTFVQSMQEYAPDLYNNFEMLLNTNENDFEKVYISFESIAIDYALIEKLPNLLVVPASFDWMDLGNFKDLSQALGGDHLGNNIQGKFIEIEDVKNSMIRNDEDKPLVVIGLDNVVVVNTPQGILVSRKDTSQKVGDISKKINNS
jgi:mannose-1-phosphate guanylyltransferase